ncbi:MAG: LysM peptidoglycan-binding domain-containing protein [Rikenellaceae bacterium]
MKYLVTIFLSLFIVCNPNVFGQFTPAPVVVSHEVTTRDGINFYIHKVEKNQTIFSISKAYGISTTMLIQDNPGLEAGLKEGETIFIRTTKAETAPVMYQKHVVRWYETLTTIAKKYNVTEDEIIRINSLKDNTIKTRQELIIPVETNQGTETEAKISRSAESKRKTIYDISLVLPIGSSNTETQDGNNNYLDFYQGFLIAVEDLKGEGMSVNLKVFDLSDYSSGLLLTQSGKLNGSDIIIGPVFVNEVESVLNYASERNIPLVSPMDPKTEIFLENHPDFYQVSSSLYSQQLDLLKNLSPRNNVTLIYESSAADKELVEMTTEILNNSRIPFSSLSYNVLSGRSVGPKIAEKLSKESMNDVIVASNSEAFVSDVLRNLNLLSSRSNYKITLFGTPRWRNFESVDINYYHSMNLHLSLQYYVDYSDENVKRFLARYRALYGSEPTPYSFLAYDVAYYFLEALYNFGPDFSKKIEKYHKQLLQTDIIFERNGSNNGFINSAARLIIYNPDYSVNISRLNR